MKINKNEISISLSSNTFSDFPRIGKTLCAVRSFGQLFYCFCNYNYMYKPLKRTCPFNPRKVLFKHGISFLLSVDEYIFAEINTMITILFELDINL